jgi:transcriptional regulator with XRE-family HTH domain
MSRKKSLFSQAVAELRSTFNENQQKFSDRLGVALATVCRWETGDRYPSPRYIKELWHLANEQDRPKLKKVFAGEFAIRAGYAISVGETGFDLRRDVADARRDATWLLHNLNRDPEEAERRAWSLLGKLDEIHKRVNELDLEPPTRALPIKIERKK